MDDEGKGSEHVGQPVNNHVLSPPHALKPGGRGNCFCSLLSLMDILQAQKTGQGSGYGYGLWSLIPGLSVCTTSKERWGARE